jgi:RNA polymerase sigma-70 factor (ECF subfamily)
MHSLKFVTLVTIMGDVNSYLKGIIKGDKSAYKLVYFELYNPLYNFALQYLKQAEQAEEMVQDTFLKLWETRDALSADTNLKNYLFTITRNGCLNQIRSEQIKAKNYDQIKYLEMQSNYEALLKLGQTDLEFNELLNQIKASVEGLPGDLKEVFMLSRNEGLKYHEIATQINKQKHDETTCIFRMGAPGGGLYHVDESTKLCEKSDL